jgi:putative aldouronate transport system permease protein
MLKSKKSSCITEVTLTKEQKWNTVRRSLRKYWELYLLLIPVLAFFIIFKYRPIADLIMAFKNYKINLGAWNSPWTSSFGFGHFIRFFQNAYFKEILWNTFSLSALQLVIGFPIPIILALIMNELTNKHFKKTLQMVTYAPHFISTVILVAIMQAILSPSTGIINQFITSTGKDAIYFFGIPAWFKPMYIISGIWQNAGYNSIVYLATLSNIDPQNIEAAKIDGANRFHIIRYVTIPAIIPTAVILLIMDAGKVMNIGFEKVYLMQNDMNGRTAEVISTYVYRSGIEGAQFSYAAAVGLFNSVINVVLLLLVNKISKKVTETSLW